MTFGIGICMSTLNIIRQNFGVYWSIITPTLNEAHTEHYISKIHILKKKLDE